MEHHPFWPQTCSSLPATSSMPELLTKYFGSIEYSEQEIVEFAAGLPGFEEESQFLVMEPPDSAPLAFLQSLRLPRLCFLILPMRGIKPDYKLNVTREDLESLGLPTTCQPRIGEEIGCFAIIVVAKNGRITANLLAPVIINRGNRRGAQAVRIDSIYSHQHLLTEATC